MSESYARKLREFMEERAQERLQSQRRVAELQGELGEQSTLAAAQRQPRLEAKELPLVTRSGGARAEVIEQPSARDGVLRP